jgi:hypothetical protein
VLRRGQEGVRTPFTRENRNLSSVAIFIDVPRLRVGALASYRAVSPRKTLARCINSHSSFAPQFVVELLYTQIRMMCDRHPQDTPSTCPTERERFSVNPISKPPNASCTDVGVVFRVSL